MLDGEVLVFEGESNVGKLDHVDHLGGSEVDGDIAVGEGETEDTLDTVVNEGEGAGLLAIAPHLKVLGGGDGLTAEGGGSLFASSLPGTTGSVDVVETERCEC